jgi:tetratricopeptide (TPR) repeat protein
MIAERVALAVPTQIAVYAVGLFACCMVCHGEVYRRKPNPAHLTSFYLLIATGGALGGVFVALVAPRVFSDFFELHLGLLLTAALFLGLWARELSKLRSRLQLVGGAAGAVALMLAGALLWQGAAKNSRARAWRQRNFYGALAVFRHEFPNPLNNQVEMMHGRIAHGMQYLHENRSAQPTLYYSHDSGVGQAFAAMETNASRRVGVVGLGAGTLATYGKPGDRIRFYEINPDVEKAAWQHFSFLRNSRADVKVVLGDARLSLEREVPQAFDLLVLDAFSGDAIPVHLLTREAFEIYRRHLKPGGTLAAHISNMSLDLEPLMLRQAHDGCWTPVVIKQANADYQNGVLPSTWVLMSQQPGSARRPPIHESEKPRSQLSLAGPAWTDDFSPVFPLLRLGASKSATSNSLAQAQSLASAAISPAESLASLRQELSRDPGSVTAMNNLAVILATAAEPKLRDGAEALRLAEKASALTGNENPFILSTLAAAYAESGRFQEAIRTSEKAIELARAAGPGSEAVVNRNLQLLEYYRRGEAYHQQDKARR